METRPKKYYGRRKMKPNDASEEVTTPATSEVVDLTGPPQAGVDIEVPVDTVATGDQEVQPAVVLQDPEEGVKGLVAPEPPSPISSSSGSKKDTLTNSVEVTVADQDDAAYSSATIVFPQ